MNFKEYVKKHPIKLTPREAREAKHWERYHLPVFDIMMSVHPRTRKILGKKMITFDGPDLEKRILQLITKVEKAFGGCVHCYGKGYATQMRTEVGADDFGGEGYQIGPRTKMWFCKCDRGKQLKKLFP
jgi:hypothetical protein